MELWDLRGAGVDEEAPSVGDKGDDQWEVLPLLKRMGMSDQDDPQDQRIEGNLRTYTHHCQEYLVSLVIGRLGAVQILLVQPPLVRTRVWKLYQREHSQGG